MTLYEYFQQARVKTIPDWFHEVQLKVTPREYQVEGLFHLVSKLPNAAIFDHPGVGKTVQMQALMIWLAALGNKSLAIMPPSLVIQFHESLLSTFIGVETFLNTAVLNGDIPERQAQIDTFQSHPEGWPDILVMSYPTFLGKQQAVAKRGKPVKPPAPETVWIPGEAITATNCKWQTLSFLGYVAVVCDEAHKLKNHKSEIHNAVRKFALVDGKHEDRNGIVLATGTPVETNVEDAYGIISLIDPDRYESKEAFDAKHILYLEGVPFKKVMEYRRLPYLYESLFARGRRITKRDAFPFMPKRVINEIQLTLTKPHAKIYKQLVDERMIELEDRIVDVTTQQALYQSVQRALLNPNMFTDKPIVTNVLFDAMDDILDVLGHRKVIIYCWFKESAETLKEHYKSYKPAVINGEVSGAARERAKKMFIEDTACQMLIANFVSGGVGLDGFQYVCSHVIFADVCSRIGAFEQAVGRLERSGQIESTTVYILVPKGTVAVKLRNDLVIKEGLANEAVCDKKTLMIDLLGKQGIQGEIT